MGKITARGRGDQRQNEWDVVAGEVIKDKVNGMW